MSTNVHATCLVMGDRGVLIRGDAGTGKTTLALALTAATLRSKGFARLVCDDRALLMVAGGRIVARAPASISGMAEIRGYGIVDLPVQSAAVVDLVVTLVPAATAPRYPDILDADLLGIGVRTLVLPQRAVDAAVPAVRCALGLSPSG